MVELHCQLLEEEQFAKALALRIEVFVHEQGVPVEEEPDDLDKEALHVGCFLGDKMVGTGRLVVIGSLGKVGRMAVLSGYRRLGVGSCILQALVTEARERDLKELVLHAQVHALGFYQKHGFIPEGNIFDEAGIAHRLMRRCFL